MVVAIDRFGVVGAARGVEWLGGGEERFDGFVAENDESGDRPETVGERLVAAGVSDPGDDVLAAKLFEITGGVAGTVGCAALTHAGGDVGGGKAVG